MEMYTWSEDSIKVTISKQELNKYGIDFTEEMFETRKAEAFFTSLFWTIASHFSIDPTTQLDVEIFDTSTDMLSMIIHFYDENGSRSPIPTMETTNELLYRFSFKEDLFAFAKRVAPVDSTEGAVVRWKPFYYLFISDPPVQKERFIALLEEYGERANVDIESVYTEGETLIHRRALEKLSERKI